MLPGRSALFDSGRGDTGRSPPRFVPEFALGGRGTFGRGAALLLAVSGRTSLLVAPRLLLLGRGILFPCGEAPRAGVGLYGAPACLAATTPRLNSAGRAVAAIAGLP